MNDVILKTSIKFYISLAYKILKEEYKVAPKCSLKFCKISEGDIPAQCGSFCSKKFILIDIEKIKSKFKNFVKLICFHEVAHLFCNELNSISGKNDEESIAGGHNLLFIEIMKKLRPNFSDEEWDLHKSRHISQYIDSLENITTLEELKSIVEFE